MNGRVTPMPTLEDIDRVLLAEHAGAADPARLAALYRKAGVMREADGAIDAACFLYTHGFVYALEAGIPEQINKLRCALVRHGREEPEG